MTDLATETWPGETARGSLQARDRHGNRSPLNRVVAMHGEQYWEERTFLQPSRGTKNHTQTLDVLRVTATLQGCEAACDYSGAVQLTLDGTVPGLVEVAYSFTKPGMYTVVVQYRGADLSPASLPYLCASHSPVDQLCISWSCQPELSKSYMDMASKLFTITFTSATVGL